MAISNLNVKQLVSVLKHARGGHIGFDPFRDPRTNTKSSLLAYMLANLSDAEIVAGVEALETSQKQPETANSSSAVMPPHAADVTTHANKSDAEQLADLLARMAASSKQPLDREAVLQLIGAQAFESDWITRTEVKSALADLRAPTRVEIVNPATQDARSLGVQHKAFPTLLKMSQARLPSGHRLNIWLKGPAGSGKTTAAEYVAEALALPFHFNGAISTEYELMGFKDAAGSYHRTPFREAYEHGGVYLFDEIDSSLPKAVLAFNAALANGHATFPDGQVKRHKDCVILAGANTAGNGATSEYSGRMKQDLAFLNRFVYLDWPLDEALETAIAQDAEWCKHVQKIRAKATKRAIKTHIISPRATLYGAALLAVGIERETVEHAVLKQGMTDETWEQLCR